MGDVQAAGPGAATNQANASTNKNISGHLENAGFGKSLITKFNRVINNQQFFSDLKLAPQYGAMLNKDQAIIVLHKPKGDLDKAYQYGVLIVDKKTNKITLGFVRNVEQQRGPGTKGTGRALAFFLPGKESTFGGVTRLAIQRVAQLYNGKVQYNGQDIKTLFNFVTK